MTVSKFLSVTALAGAVLIASPAASLAQPASSSQPGQNQCFLSRDVNGFNAPNDHTLYIRVGVRDVYRLDLMVDCLNLSFRQSFGLKSTPANPWVCSPLDAEVVYGDSGIPQRCPITAIHKLTAAELAALPKKDRP